MDHHKNYIYLDNQSTTPIDERVLNAMLPYLTIKIGNPSSDNFFGNNVKTAINHAREQVSALINARYNEIYFTSGATEALNWALRGVAEKAPKGQNHIVISSIEHSAVLRTCEFLERKFGFLIQKIKPGESGVIEPSQIKAAIKEHTLLVAVQHANNEIGTVQPIKEIGNICQARGILFLVDAAQSVGKIPCDVNDMHIDLLAASGHKLYAPKGIGFLFISENAKTKINPLTYGGGQENNFRAGTQNVPYIIGFGEACAICLSSMEEEAKRLISLRTTFINFILNKIPDMVINGTLEKRLPGNINFSVPGINSDVLLRNVGNIIISKGSACNSAKRIQSHVLQSISTDENIIDAAIRIGIGRFNTEPEILIAAEKIAAAVEEIQTSNAQF